MIMKRETPIIGNRHSAWSFEWSKTLLVSLLLCLSFSLRTLFKLEPFISNVEKIQKCSIHNFHQDLSFLDNVKPITHAEFIRRRNKLAEALHLEGVDGFVLEPGYTFQYYGNISQTDWEPWEPEERPMLMIVEPMVNLTSGEVQAKTSFLAPHFEEGRVRMLGIPSEEELSIVIWEEHWNPYTTLRDQLFEGKVGIKLMVDEEIRDFIVRGLGDAGFDTVGLRGEVEAVRQIKTNAEIDILRAVNTGTVKAIRSMRPCLKMGLTENQVMGILDNTMRSIDFTPFFDIVLIEENAALPHGGFVTGNNKITEHSMILIDVGARYLGYSSDVCRSFFIDPPQKGIWRFILEPLQWAISLIKPSTHSLSDHGLLSQKLDVWSLVLEAQSAARAKFLPNNTASSVDIAARDVISSAGYGPQFTHRVGHGIGIKAHESPYLNKGNLGIKLRPGMVFTDEPGVYILNKFGVRHEDIYLIKEEGEAENLSGGEAKGPWEP